MPDNTAPSGRAGSQPPVTAVAGASGNAARTDSGPAVSNDQAAVPSGGNGSTLKEVAGLIGTQEVDPGSTANMPRRSCSLDSSQTQEQDATLEDTWAAVSKAQKNILAMERGLMEKFGRFLEPEHTDTTPVEPRTLKGKNVDPVIGAMSISMMRRSIQRRSRLYWRKLLLIIVIMNLMRCISNVCELREPVRKCKTSMINIRSPLRGIRKAESSETVHHCPRTWRNLLRMRLEGDTHLLNLHCHHRKVDEVIKHPFFMQATR